MEYLKIDWRGEGAAEDDEEQGRGAGGPRSGDAARDLARIRSLMEGTATYPVISAATAAVVGGAGLAASVATYALLAGGPEARPLAMVPEAGGPALRLGLVWGAALVVAAAGELFLTKRTAEGRRLRSFYLPRGSPLLARVRLAYLAPLFVGAALTGGLARAGAWQAIPAAWLLSYGAALVCAGLFSSAPVRALGGVVLAIGALAAALPGGNLAWLALGFGASHLAYAAQQAGAAPRSNDEQEERP